MLQTEALDVAALRHPRLVHLFLPLQEYMMDRDKFVTLGSFSSGAHAARARNCENDETVLDGSLQMTQANLINNLNRKLS